MVSVSCQTQDRYINTSYQLILLLLFCVSYRIVGLGAWIAFLIARKRPELIGGILGMSADADFTEELLWKNLDDDVKEKIMSGMYEITWGTEKYAITRNLIEDGRKNLLLTGGPGSVDVSCPVRLLHAFNDEEVG